MKVVLFCGGLGTRMREYSETIPKPMVNIGYRPIIWHVMKYYAYFGHKDFILCLGYKADMIKSYFLNYSEWLSNDFELTDGGKLHLFNSDIQDWKITFVDTGLTANIGQRFKAIEPYLEEEEVFLANYSDGLTDLHLPTLIDYFTQRDKIGCFLCVRPNVTFHLVDVEENGLVSQINDINLGNIWINGGYFIFKKDIFKFINYGEELVHEPFQRLIENKELLAYKYTGFFGVMDTFKEKQMLDDMYARGETPWEVWRDKKLEQYGKQQC
jgi:glucose-1-phosphate cytidylyltransferase